MVDEIRKTTVPIPPVGADGEQPILNTTTGIISGETPEINYLDEISEENFQEIQRRLDRISNPAYLHTVTLNELYETTYPSRPPIIDGLLYPGTYLLAGAPKVGKSFLVAQLAYHISTGQPLWDYPVHKSTVLYLALEDDYKRLQDRMFRMFGVDCTEELHFATCAKQIGSGLEDQLELFLKEHPGTRLVIVDTLQKVRELGSDTYSYASDYEIVGKLKQFADKYGICLLLVHHTRKQPANDKFEMISGTTGLLGCADGAFLLQKERGTSLNATMDIVGRDQGEHKSLVGTVKETIMQVSSSKKWQSKPALDENGNPLLTAKGKPILKKSYSILQDDFFNAMRAAGYTDVARGERGSTEEHLTVTQFKVAQESARLEVLEAQVEKKEQQLQKISDKTRVLKTTAVTLAEIDGMGRKTFTGKLELTPQEGETLKQLARKGVVADAVISDLKQKLTSARKDACIWKERYEKLLEQTKDFLAAVKRAPEKVRVFLDRILHMDRTESRPAKKRETTLTK